MSRALERFPLQIPPSSWTGHAGVMSGPSRDAHIRTERSTMASLPSLRTLGEFLYLHSVLRTC